MAYNKNNRNNNDDRDDKSDFRKRSLHRKKKVCAFCADKTGEGCDYKNVNMLKKYVSEKGKILPRRITGCCAAHQRVLTTAVKRARHIAIMPYTVD